MGLDYLTFTSLTPLFSRPPAQPSEGQQLPCASCTLCFFLLPHSHVGPLPLTVITPRPNFHSSREREGDRENHRLGDFGGLCHPLSETGPWRKWPLSLLSPTRGSVSAGVWHFLCFSNNRAPQHKPAIHLLHVWLQRLTDLCSRARGKAAALGWRRHDTPLLTQHTPLGHFSLKGENGSLHSLP